MNIADIVDMDPDYSVYQYYKKLKSLYNQSGRILLTGNQDADYHILSLLEVDDLSKVCRSNKYTRRLCDDETFWQYKFNKESLDILKKPDSLEGWLKLYKISKKAALDAKHTLMVYDVQYQTNKPPIEIFNNLEDMSLNGFLALIDNAIQFADPINFISIVPSKDVYDITLYFIHDDVTPIITMTKNNLIKLFGYLYRYSWPNEDYLSFYCEESGLIINQAYLALPNISNGPLIYTRKGILDSILYYQY